jgi:hypothetical protein
MTREFFLARVYLPFFLLKVSVARAKWIIKIILKKPMRDINPVVYVGSQCPLFDYSPKSSFLYTALLEGQTISA